jgi:hypothetical protein
MAYSSPLPFLATSALISIASFCIGCNKSLCHTNLGIQAEEQAQVCTAVGVAQFVPQSGENGSS